MLEIGPGHAYESLSVAAAALRDGDIVRIFPGRYESCAVLRADDLLIEGAGDAEAVVLAGGICQGKAILVAAGRGLVIRNLTLAEAQVPEGNGAGIRAEGGTLTVEGVRFIHDQDGILASASVPDMVLVVRHSLFLHDGACIRACAHGIYAGHIGQLVVSDSVFAGTREGHAIKSRAQRTEVTGCTIADGPDGTGSYSIEAPNGGALLIAHNTLEKGPHSGNRAAIAIGTEGMDQPTPPARIEANRFTNDSARHAVFVRNDTHAPAELQANTLTGAITPLTGPGTVQ